MLSAVSMIGYLLPSEGDECDDERSDENLALIYRVPRALQAQFGQRLLRVEPNNQENASKEKVQMQSNILLFSSLSIFLYQRSVPYPTVNQSSSLYHVFKSSLKRSIYQQLDCIMKFLLAFSLIPAIVTALPGPVREYAIHAEDMSIAAKGMFLIPCSLHSSAILFFLSSYLYSR